MSDVEEISRQPETASSTASEETATHVVDIRASEGAASTRAVHRFTPSERAARGKAARRELPRSAHGAWEPGPMRRDAVDLLEEQARTRLPELGPIRP